MRPAFLRSLFGAVIAIAACGHPTASPASDAAPPTPSLSLYVSPGMVTLKEGGLAEVSVTLTADPPTSAEITATGMPDGVTRDPVIINSDGPSLNFVLRAKPTAPLVSVAQPVTIVANAENGLHAEATVWLAVAPPSGALDTTFGGTGFVTLDVDGDPTTTETPLGLGVDDQGLALVAGRIDAADPMIPPRSFVLQLRPEGTIDTLNRLGPSGRDLGPPNSTAMSAVFDDSRIWVVADPTGDFVIRNMDTLDDTTIDVGGLDVPSAVAENVYGTIVAGTTTTGTGTHVALVGLLPNWLPMPDFGTAGIALFDFAGPVTRIADVDFGVLHGAAVADVAGAVTLADLTSQGTLDPLALGGTGLLSFAPINTSERGVAVMAVDDQFLSSYVVSAAAPDGTLVLRKVHRDGTLDPAFGAGAGVLTDDALVGVGDAVRVPDGSFVVTGARQTPSGTELAVARYHRIGARDSWFGTNGVATVAIGASSAGARVAVESNGEITVAGTSDGRLAVARFWP